MIVADLDVVRVTVNESKADTPLIVHGDGVLALAVTLERMESIARRHLSEASHQKIARLLQRTLYGYARDVRDHG